MEEEVNGNFSEDVEGEAELDGAEANVVDSEVSAGEKYGTQRCSNAFRVVRQSHSNVSNKMVRLSGMVVSILLLNPW